MEHEIKTWFKGFYIKGWEVVCFGKESEFAHQAMTALNDPKVHAILLEPKNWTPSFIAEMEVVDGMAPKSGEFYRVVVPKSEAYLAHRIIGRWLKS